LAAPSQAAGGSTGPEPALCRAPPAAGRTRAKSHRRAEHGRPIEGLATVRSGSCSDPRITGRMRKNGEGVRK
jgi:hypothetical protein